MQPFLIFVNIERGCYGLVMSLATHIAPLRCGQTVRFRPTGHSMTGRVNHGDLVEVAPCTTPPVQGDVVLCKVRGRIVLHLVSAARNGRFQISNNHRHVNGWTGPDHIYGVVVAVNPPAA